MASIDGVVLSSGLQGALTALKQVSIAEQRAAVELSQQATQQLKQSVAAASSGRGNIVNISV
ncbi:MAG: hypothetical protein VW802_12970 [Rhodospirillaceae bacterium]|jgi:hypothetical protein